MTDRPILGAIRSLLRFKDYATIAEIASIAEVSRKRALNVLNTNGRHVWRDRKNGRITRVDPRTELQEQLWKSGRYYRISTYGMFAKEGDCIEFAGNAELRARLQEKRVIGAIGDNSTTSVIIDTPENRAAVEAAGLSPWSEVTIDDRLWEEDQP